MTTNSINDERTVRGEDAVLGRIDQYELIKELGGGGFGTVYLAKDTVAGIEVAVKGLPPMIKGNAEELENIRANFALVSRLHHPYIAAALHLQLAREVAYASEDVRQKLRVLPGDTLMVMEYAPGVTLSKWRKQFPGGKVPLDQALQIGWQIAQALDYAHEQRIIHRDIKPSNIMVETKPDGEVVARVLDFGLAAEIRSSMGRVSREVHDTSGTRPYMAPEQWLAEKQGARTDQYALAVLFHELVTGEVPFAPVFETGDPMVMRLAVTMDIPTTPADLPKSMRRALAIALAKRPEERFASCGEFVGVLAGKIKFSRGSWGGRKRGVGKALALLALLGMLAGVGAWALYNNKKATKVKTPETMMSPAKVPLPVDPKPTTPAGQEVLVAAPVTTTNGIPAPKPSRRSVAARIPEAEREDAERQRINEHQVYLNAEKSCLRAAVSEIFSSATNVFNQVSKYRAPPDGFRRHLEKVDSLWGSVSSVTIPEDATPEQLTNVLMSVSNVVARIRVERKWLEENRKLRDEILTVRDNANAICERFAILEGNHWCTHQGYIDGTNALEVGAERLGKGELPSAFESMKDATNLLQTAYSDEQEFISREKSEAEEKCIAANVHAYTDCLVQIASLRREASNEYAKISLVRQNSRGFAPRLVKIDKLWNVINDNSQVDTLVGAQGTCTSTSNALQQIKEEIEWVVGHESLRDNIQARRDVTMHAIRRLQDDVTLKTQAWTVDPRYISATSRYAMADHCFTEGLLSKDLANDLLAICNEIEQLHKDRMNDAKEPSHKNSVNNEPVVKSVTIRQSIETKEVVVSYVLENSRAFITLDFLQDGKAAFPKGTVRTISGDVNKWVEPGIRQIIWKCVDDIPNEKLDGIAAKVTALRRHDIEHDGENLTEETNNANFAGNNEEEMPKNQIVVRTYVWRHGSRNYVTPTDFWTRANYKMFLERMPQYSGSVVVVESSKLNTPTFIVSLACGKYKGKVALSFKKSTSETIDVELKEDE